MIREATINDIINIVNLEAEVLKETLGLEFYDTEFRENPFAKYYVIEEYNHLIGFIGSRMYGDFIEVMNFVVTMKYQRMGYGQALLDKILEIGIKQGAKTISLEVREDNNKARKFYKKNGFILSHIRENYYGDANALLLIKEL